MTEPTQAERDAWSERFFKLLQPHMRRLHRDGLPYRRDMRKAEICVPLDWDELKIGPRLGECFRMPVVTADVPWPVVRAERAIPPELEDTLSERLEQRTAALGRVAAENELLRAALLRVLERADVERDLGLVRAEDIHDAVGGELIAGLYNPPVEWRDATPVTLEGYADALQSYVRAGMLTGDEREHRLASVMGVRRVTVSEMLAQYVDRMTVPTAEIPAAFQRSEAERISRCDD
jgi:hypothetical protein